LCQTIPVLSTVLALLALSDVLTILVFPGLEQLFAILRIADLSQALIVYNSTNDRLFYNQNKAATGLG